MTKAEYWKNRKAGKRGQGEIKPVFYEKGETVPYVNRKGKEDEYNNGSGQHLVKTNKGFERLNHKQARSLKSKSHASKKGFKYHVVNPPRKLEPREPVGMTNHERMLHRKKERELAYAERRNAKNNS